MIIVAWRMEEFGDGELLELDILGENVFSGSIGKGLGMKESEVRRKMKKMNLKCYCLQGGGQLAASSQVTDPSSVTIPEPNILFGRSAICWWSTFGKPPDDR